MTKDKLNKANDLSRKIGRYQEYYSFARNAVIDEKQYRKCYLLWKGGTDGEHLGDRLNIDDDDSELIIKILELVESETKTKLKELKAEFEKL